MPVRVVADERERNSRIPELVREAGASVDFALLPVGDYIVSPEEVVERKTVRDLISSIYDGRLYIQCAQLVKHFQKPVIVIQGDIADLEVLPEDLDENQARRLAERMPLAYEAISTIIMEFRIPVVHTPSAEYTANLLLTLATRSLKEGKASGPLLRKIKKENPVYIQQLSVLSSVPGIGDKLAARMLQKFQTPSRALNASAAQLATIPGFGLARAERVRRILDSSNTVSKVIQRTLFDPE
ncbi:MAG TPA: ERCC4 domain-containing protein [Nitrososphaera sp.]|nr:ERCC4 domain-containing protein [Nitrososphaera sp.]